MQNGRPELVISGAARSGTTFLASLLSFHPEIDAPRIKEPNYFASRHEMGAEWYEELFPGVGRISVDASAQYTYPSLMVETFERMAPSRGTRAVYLVREPLERAFSHYCQEEIYLQNEHTTSFGEVASRDADAIAASDYSRTLPHLVSVFGSDRLIIIPFEQLTSDPEGTVDFVLRWLAVDPELLRREDMRASSHLFTNERAVISNKFVRRVFNALRRTTMYPKIRSIIGPTRIRQLRSRLTRSTSLPTLREGLATCSPDELQGLAELRERASQSVARVLEEQDRRHGLSWRQECAWLDQTF